MTSTSLRRACAAAIAALGLCGGAHAQGMTELKPRSYLHASDYVGLNRWFSGWQSQFESGHLDEYGLFDQYRTLFIINRQEGVQLKAWAEQMPTSYPAHLLLGAYYEHLANGARGRKFISETPDSALKEMHRLNAAAVQELQRSTELTAKPYVSWLLMLEIAQGDGTPKDARYLLDQALRVDPVAELARIRYMKTLTPRWGGSTEEMDAFVVRNRRDGVPERVVHELQAIEEDDAGENLKDAGDEGAANPHFEKALALAKDSPQSFFIDSLNHSQGALCWGVAVLPANCPH